MREIGYVMTGADHKLIPFTLKNGEKVEVGDYVVLKHPHKGEETLVLARVLMVRPYNPEMKTGRPGPHEASRYGRERFRYGSPIEYKIAYAEPLGYYDEEGRWRSLECAPSTWEPVYEPSEEELKTFFRPRNNQNGLLITIGHVSKHKGIPVQIDLSEVAKGHMFICGMTRSGKSTFVVNLAINALRTRPRPRIIIIDRRGEYSVLSEYGALVFDYRSFLPRPEEMNPVVLADIIADLIGVPDGDRTIRNHIATLVNRVRDAKVEFTAENLRSFVDTLDIRGARDRLLLYLERLDTALATLVDSKRPRYDIVEVIKKHPVVVIDFSTDPNVIYQHLAVARMIRRVVRYAIEKARAKEPFAAIFVIEEAQYIAPERGMRIEVGKPEKVGADKALVEGVSQAGGYNVGFIVMTQRPAYVMKSVISQCNTIMCFRLRNPNDQDTVSRYTEYGGERLTTYMPGLADFEGILCGMASTIPFPVIVETRVMEYPRKATMSAREAWEAMDRELEGAGQGQEAGAPEGQPVAEAITPEAPEPSEAREAEPPSPPPGEASEEETPPPPEPEPGQPETELVSSETEEPEEAEEAPQPEPSAPVEPSEEPAEPETGEANSGEEPGGPEPFMDLFEPPF